ncbi:hypothetical protein AAC387_Pa03g1766 [Persea americana]
MHLPLLYWFFSEYLISSISVCCDPVPKELALPILGEAESRARGLREWVSPGRKWGIGKGVEALKWVWRNEVMFR